MYINLLIFTILEVSADWVEISQHHYRKPFNSQFHTKPRERAEENTYSNHSIVDYYWQDSIHRRQSTNNIKLLNFPTGNVYQSTTEETFTIETVDTSEASDEFGFTEEIPFVNKDFGYVERIPNVGSVQRVQLTKSPVRSPILKHSGTSIQGNPPVRFQNVHKNTNPNIDEDEINLESEIQETDKAVKPIFDKHEDIAEHKISLTKSKTRQNTTEPTFTTIRKNSHVFPTTARFRDEYSTEYFKNKRNQQQIKNNFVTEKSRDHLQENVIRPLSSISYGHNIAEENRDKSTIVPNNITNKPPLPFKNRNNIQKENFTKDELSSKQQSKVNNNQAEKVKNKKENDDKSNTMENVMKFMKIVADTISRNTRRNIGSKMRYLEDLKENILTNVADRIESTWPDDDDDSTKAPDRRQSRSTDANARGHVEFPSSESSLMTISFLTFAVFLIKLILQVIQTYKNKTMMVAPVVVATAGRAAFKKMRATNDLNNSNP